MKETVHWRANLSRNLKSAVCLRDDGKDGVHAAQGVESVAL